MTNEAASLSLQCLLLRAVVDGQAQEMERLKKQNDWLRRANRGLHAQIETLETK